MITPMLSMHGQQTPNNRRLQAIMSEECKAACPGTEAMIKAMMEAAAGGAERRLDAHEKENEAAMMKLYCEHIDALKCSAAEEKCQDPGAEQDAAGQAMMECACACPKIAEMGDDSSMICSNKADTVGCITSTASCSALAAQMNEKEIDLGCEYVSKKCEDKEKDMMTCMGEEDMTSWGTEKCDSEVKEACCTLGGKMITCMGSDCYTIQLAMAEMRASSADVSEEEKKAMKESMEVTNKYRTECPDAGIPSAAAVSATASEGKVSSGEGDSGTSDFATPGQTMSMLAMAAVIAASFMA
jgi:hypothetical protein